MKKHFSGLLVFILFVWGCASTETVKSSKVAPSEIHQNYLIEASGSQTGVTATFRVGGERGTTVDLDAPAGIEHNGVKMTERAPSFFQGTTYRSYANRYEPAHRFVYTDADGKTYRNEIAVEPVTIRAEGMNLNPFETIHIPLSRPIHADESVSLSLDSEIERPAGSANGNGDPQNTKDYSLSDIGIPDETRSALLVVAPALEKFVAGKAILTVTIRKSVALRETAGKGGALTLVYKTSAAVNVLK